jgi:hypothetical protein
LGVASVDDVTSLHKLQLAIACPTAKARSFALASKIHPAIPNGPWYEDRAVEIIDETLLDKCVGSTLTLRDFATSFSRVRFSSGSRMIKALMLAPSTVVPG